MNNEVEGVPHTSTSLSLAHASFLGETAYDYSGRCVDITGDYNGDGINDILIGSDGNDDGGTAAGKAYVIFGKEEGWSIDINLAYADASFIGENANDFAGSSVAYAGDVNGDGFDDILIGAYGNDDGGTSAGKAYLIFGKSTGWETDMDLSDADVSFYGETASEEAGEFLAGAGDVNNDGFDDILISAVNNDESANQAGKVYLIFGKANGWRATAQLSLADASFRGETANDVAGTSVDGAGDVNGDGYYDIVIGAPINGEAYTQAGQVYLIFGGSSGWSRNTSLSSSDGSFRGEASLDQAGSCVAGAGDVNNDDLDDILISAPFNDDGGSNAGKVYLILGAWSGWAMDTGLSSADASYVGEDSSDELGCSLSGTGDIDLDDYGDFAISTRLRDERHTNGGKTYVIRGREADWPDGIKASAGNWEFIGAADNDYSGTSISAGGDVNGDGVCDLLIGAYGNDDRGSSSGKTYLILISARQPYVRNLRAYVASDGSSITIEWDRTLFWPEPFTGYGIQRSTGDTSSWDTVCGDTSDLSFTDHDVTVGTTYTYKVRRKSIGERPHRGTYPGATVTIFCEGDFDEDGLSDSIDPDDDNDGIPDEYDSNPYGKDFTNWGRVDINLSTIGNKFYGEDNSDYSSLSIDMSGDVNGDGIDDLLIGSYANDDGGTTAGKVYLFFGRTGGWSGNINLSSADASFIGEELNDRAGISGTIAGDINGDGYNDIIIGADEYRPTGGQQGRAYIIFGRPGGWRRNMDLSRADVRLQGEENTDEFGSAVASGGDINGDGYDDVLIGAPRYEPTYANFSGKVYLLLGRPSFVPFISASSMDAGFVGSGDDEHCGCTLAIDGDVNGDGIDDMVIGAKFYKKSGSQNNGRAYLFLGNRSAPSLLTYPDATFIGQRAFAGWSVAIPGDVNIDGYDDILIGEPENSEGGSAAGQVYLIFGKSSNWTTGQDLGTADASFWGEDALDNAGYYVDGAGDVNWDGMEDIIIGAPGNAQGGKVGYHEAGKTYIVFGKKEGWNDDIDLVEADVSFYGEYGDDSSGYTVAGGGDPDNDGRPDILIGAWTASHYGQNTGTTYYIGHTHYEPVGNISTEYKSNSTGIHLSWDDTVTPPGFYGIYRGVPGSGVSRIANTTASNYTDWDITLGLTYTYFIVAVDPFGTSSPLGNPIHVLADKDTDKDGIGDLFDWDDDGDGVADGQDFFPTNSTEWLDTDLDGIGNNADTDDDNDGIPDSSDAEPLNPLNAISVDVDLDELYDRLLEMEDNLTTRMTNLETNLRTRVDNMWNDIIMHVRGMNATMRALVTTSITQVMGRINTLQASIHGHIEDFWDDYNATEQNEAQHLIDMNDRILLAITDLETSLNAKIDGLAGPEKIIQRIEDLEDRYNLSMEDLTDEIVDGFTSVETLMTNEFSDLEAYIGLQMVQLQAELKLANMSLHHHLDKLAELFEEMLDDDIADLVVVIEGETTTIGGLVRSQIADLSDENSGDHQAIIEMLTELAGKSTEVNLSEIMTEIRAVQASLELISDLDDAITKIENMELSVEEGDRELSDNDSQTHLFLIILMVLVVIVISLLIVNIIVGNRKKAKDENDDIKGPVTRKDLTSAPK